MKLVKNGEKIAQINVYKGGAVVEGTFGITENGVYNVASYEKVNVDVPEPEGTKEITENGEYDIKDFAKVNVDVSVPEEYIIPTGWIEVVNNGSYDVKNYARVDVNVPSPKGSTEITENGTHNVYDFAEAVVNVNPPLQEKTATPKKDVSQIITPDEDYYGLSKVVVEPIPDSFITPEGTFGINENGEYDITQYEKVSVEIPEPVGTKDITKNGVYNIKMYEEVNVQVESEGFGIEDATATSSDLLLGKVAYNNEGRFVGTIETYSGENEEGELIKDGYSLKGLIERTITTIEAEDVETIGLYSFYNNTSLKSASFPNATIVNQSAFSGCSSLTEINLPLATNVGAYAFNGCKALESISLPNVENNEIMFTFASCTSLKNVNLPKLKGMVMCSFSGCEALETINLPSVESIGLQVFSSCKALKSIYFPVLNNLGNQAFLDCSALTDIYLGYEGVVVANVDSFSGTNDGIKIHVRSDYANSYASAENWANLISSGKVVIVGDYES